MVLNGGCAHDCVNLDGSFECSCRDGFSLESDNRTCADIDECSTGVCSQRCVNLNGGFRCECDPGYALEPDGFTCSGKRLTGYEGIKFVYSSFVQCCRF